MSLADLSELLKRLTNLSVLAKTRGCTNEVQALSRYTLGIDDSHKIKFQYGKFMEKLYAKIRPQRGAGYPAAYNYKAAVQQDDTTDFDSDYINVITVFLKKYIYVHFSLLDVG
ncbi:hypothetical protein FACS1894206_06690 [Deltaproteobacteria bacterium]|nr:hypothetical protein FACS1894206_06690 [Deltaproteobacteria bacterium]